MSKWKSNVPKVQAALDAEFPLAFKVRAHRYADGTVMLGLNLQLSKEEYDAAEAEDACAAPGRHPAITALIRHAFWRAQ